MFRNLVALESIQRLVKPGAAFQKFEAFGAKWGLCIDIEGLPQR